MRGWDPGDVWFLGIKSLSFDFFRVQNLSVSIPILGIQAFEFLVAGDAGLRRGVCSKCQFLEPCDLLVQFASPCPGPSIAWQCPKSWSCYIFPKSWSCYIFPKSWSCYIFPKSWSCYIFSICWLGNFQQVPGEELHGATGLLCCRRWGNQLQQCWKRTCWIECHIAIG